MSPDARVKKRKTSTRLEPRLGLQDHLAMSGRAERGEQMSLRPGRNRTAAFKAKLKPSSSRQFSRSTTSLSIPPK